MPVNGAKLQSRSALYVRFSDYEYVKVCESLHAYGIRLE